LSSYTDVIAADHRADVRTVDFASDPEGAEDTINQWASDQTNGKIPRLLQNNVTAATCLVAVNTVYFKGSWAEPFDASLTKILPFYRLDGTSAAVPMMYKPEEYYRCLMADTFKAVLLPYCYGSTLGLLIIEPAEGSFSEIEKTVTAGGMYALARDMSSVKLNLTMPKFKTRTRRLINDDLIFLGMTDVFLAEKADLSGMDGGGKPYNLYLQFVVHEAVIDVDEKGTEAAAATAAGVDATGMPLPEQPVDFTLDRPFIFAVYDTATDAVLFLGRVLDPSQGESTTTRAAGGLSTP